MMQTRIQHAPPCRNAGRTLSHSILALALLSLLFSASSQLNAQGSVAPVTVSTGAGYANEVYYNLHHGVVKTAPLAEWDIAFQIPGFASAIQINGGAGVRLYNVPGKTAANWSDAIDTTGMAATWKPWNNSTETWDLGAFNMESDYETGNFGWGEYNPVTHTVSGTALYVIVLPNGTARKIMIDGLTSGTYSFRYADLNGGNEVTATVAKSEFGGKGFGYYSIRDGHTVDHEPAIEEWDLLFGKYVAMVGPSLDTPYPVTGIRTNMGVSAARVVSATPQTEAAPSDDAYSPNITTIGYDWKSFTGSAWKLNDSLAFFVKRSDNSIYRLVFTGFGGSGTGEFMFNQEQLNASSVRDEEGKNITAGVYPSVLAPNAHADLVYALDRSAASARANVFDAMGRLVSTHDLDGTSGLHRTSIQVPASSGVYFVQMQFDAAHTSLRMVVR